MSLSARCRQHLAGILLISYFYFTGAFASLIKHKPAIVLRAPSCGHTFIFSYFNNNTRVCNRARSRGGGALPLCSPPVCSVADGGARSGAAMGTRRCSVADGGAARGPAVFGRGWPCPFRSGDAAGARGGRGLAAPLPCAAPAGSIHPSARLPSIHESVTSARSVLLCSRLQDCVGGISFYFATLPFFFFFPPF